MLNDAHGSWATKKMFDNRLLKMALSCKNCKNAVKIRLIVNYVEFCAHTRKNIIFGIIKTLQTKILPSPAVVYFEKQLTYKIEHT